MRSTTWSARNEDRAPPDGDLHERTQPVGLIPLVEADASTGLRIKKARHAERPEDGPAGATVDCNVMHAAIAIAVLGSGMTKRACNAHAAREHSKRRWVYARQSSETHACTSNHFGAELPLS